MPSGNRFITFTMRMWIAPGLLCATGEILAYFYCDVTVAAPPSFAYASEGFTWPEREQRVCFPDRPDDGKHEEQIKALRPRTRWRRCFGAKSPLALLFFSIQAVRPC